MKTKLIFSALISLSVFISCNSYAECEKNSLYNNSLENSYNSKFKDTNVNIDCIKNSETIKKILPYSLGTNVSHSSAPFPFDYEGVKSNYPKMLDALDVKSIRIAMFDIGDPLDRNIDDKLWRDYLISQGKPYSPKPEGLRLYLSDFLNLSTTKDLIPAKKGLFLFGLNAFTGYDTSEDKSFHVLENIDKYVPIIAKRNADVIREFKNKFGEGIFKNVIFEIGNEIYLEMDTTTYAKVIEQSIIEMRKVSKNIRVSFSTAIMYPHYQGLLTEKNIGWFNKPNLKKAFLDYYKNPKPPYDYVNSNLFKELNRLDKNSDIKKYIKGLQLHNYLYFVSEVVNVNFWKQQLNNVRKQAVENGFGNTPYWISEYNFLGAPSDQLHILSQLESSYGHDYIRRSFELITRKDVEFIHFFSLPFTGFSEFNANATWSEVDSKILYARKIEPYLINKKFHFWRILPVGYMYSVMQKVFFDNSPYINIKSLNSNEDFFQVFGLDNNNKLKGIIINLKENNNTFTLNSNNISKLKIISLKNPENINFILNPQNYKNEFSIIHKHLLNIEKEMDNLHVDSRVKFKVKHEIRQAINSIHNINNINSDKQIRDGLEIMFQFLDGNNQLKHDIDSIKNIISNMTLGKEKDIIKSLRLEKFPKKSENIISNSGNKFSINIPAKSIIYISEDANVTVSLEEALFDSK